MPENIIEEDTRLHGTDHDPTAPYFMKPSGRYAGWIVAGCVILAVGSLALIFFIFIGAFG